MCDAYRGSNLGVGCRDPTRTPSLYVLQVELLSQRISSPSCFFMYQIDFGDMMTEALQGPGAESAVEHRKHQPIHVRMLCTRFAASRLNCIRRHQMYMLPRECVAPTNNTEELLTLSESGFVVGIPVKRPPRPH